MIGLSQSTGYAVLALVCLDGKGGEACFIREVADCSKIPKAYLAQIINRLAHKGIVTAKRGYRGGVSLSRPPEEITLLQVVEAMEGKDWIGECLFGINECGGGFVCPTRKFWTQIRQQIEAELRKTTLADFIRSAGFKEVRERRLETSRNDHFEANRSLPLNGRRAVSKP